MSSVIYSKPPTFSSDDYRSLLLLDSLSLHATIFRSIFRNDFISVITSQNVESAEEILESEPISHIVTSARFSDEAPISDLVIDWKRRYSSILRVILFTGGNIGEFADPSIFDAVLKKPARNFEICMAVLGTNRDSNKRFLV